LELTIDKLVYGGDGLARLPADEHGRGKAVFAPFVLSGERIEATITEEKSGFARARVGSILSASGYRVEPKCPYFRRCGGCHYQHATYEHQPQIKVDILRENLRRIAKIELGSEIQVHASPPWNYRNRARLKVQTAPESAIGYHKFGSHELLPVRECPISSPLINKVLEALWQGGAFPSGLQEIEIFADAQDEHCVIELYCSPNGDADDISGWLSSLRRNCPLVLGATVFRTEAANVTIHPEALLGQHELTYKTSSASYRISAGAFFQVNRFLVDELVQIVCGERAGQFALDLYSGVGLFSIVLARTFAQVIAVESSPISHADLRYNSPLNVKAVRATTEQFLSKQGSKLNPEFVVVDPPRAGLGKQAVQDLVRLAVPRLTYVSCDPATLARDLGPLLASGYRIEQTHLVDLFPQTYHVESVIQLVR
jgi:23S rRNA (uracil1939-C5)-methyltransferase